MCRRCDQYHDTRHLMLDEIMIPSKVMQFRCSLCMQQHESLMILEVDLKQSNVVVSAIFVVRKGNVGAFWRHRIL